MEIMPMIGVVLCGIGATMIGRIGTIRGIIDTALPTGILKIGEIQVISKTVSTVVHGMLILAGGLLLIILYDVAIR